MKANELSIGDWVCAVGTVINGEEHLTPPMRVEQICETWVRLQIDPQVGDPDEYDIADIRPVPLTGAILEQNGFTNIGKTPCHANYKLVVNEYDGALLVQFFKKPSEVRISFDPIIVFSTYGCSIHNLQHALRLANIEKEIEL
ncbi:MAG: hypothetical protein NC209_04205 [Alistipes sp.]|nr:hypothetical protein [Lachnospiraceae bacterium]MCM1250330.1 hypothetical protein [Alistipes sp.]